MSQRSAGSCTRCTRANAFPVTLTLSKVLSIIFRLFFLQISKQVSKQVPNQCICHGFVKDSSCYFADSSKDLFNPCTLDQHTAQGTWVKKIFRQQPITTDSNLKMCQKPLSKSNIASTILTLTKYLQGANRERIHVLGYLQIRIPGYV